MAVTIELAPAEVSIIVMALSDLLHTAPHEHAAVAAPLLERIEEADRAAQLRGVEGR